VIAALFGEASSSCDLNGDGIVSAADLLAAILSLVVPPTATPTVIPSDTPAMTPTASPLFSATVQAPSPTASPPTPSWTFTDVTERAGLKYTSDPQVLRGNVAVGDYDRDGWPDVYMVLHDMGSLRPNLLFHNRGDDTFEQVAQAPGVVGSGATFVDFDGDGWLDLFLAGSGNHPSPQLYRNHGGGTFEDITRQAGIAIDYESDESHSAAFGDCDRDGYLDLFITHWGHPSVPSRTLKNLWHNNGDGTFTDVTAQAGVLGLATGVVPILGGQVSSWMYTPNFADVNNDGWPDLLIAADYATSRVFVNNHDRTFTDTTSNVISDQNGMGAAIGDYDNDGNLDWFVTSIWDPNDIPGVPYVGTTGNRLYRGHGDGTFEDVTDKAGVRRGDWGWGTCFADFNNDGYLDIFQVNGVDFYLPARFFSDPSRLFVANGDGTFTERSQQLGIDDHGLGLGVACFDYDGDGDVDVLIANNGQSARLYRNDGGNQNNFLDVNLSGRAPNSEAVGARIYVTVGGQTQMRELHVGSNFASQDPVVAHFGLGNATTADTVRVVWPDQGSTSLNAVAARQRLTIVQP
jgi:hypothetical protein